MSTLSRKFPWAANLTKLERAVKAAGEKGTEKEIKALYISYAGRVIELEAKPKKRR